MNRSFRPNSSEDIDRAVRWANYPKYLHSFPIQSRPYRPKAKNLRNWYLDDGLSANQIAEKLGVSKTFVLDRLREMGIQSDESGDRLTNPHNYRSSVVPYGFKVNDGKLVPHYPELKICRKVVALVREGHSFRSVTRELATIGFKNRIGKVNWDHSTVKSIYERWSEKL